MKPEPILYADGARGVYIPQHFAETIRRDALHNVRSELLDILAIGPDEPDYWEVWQEVEDNAIVKDAGINYRLHQNGDLWLIPDGMTWDDGNEWFIWPSDENNDD